MTNPHPIDAHVGSRLRSRRRMLGMTQEKLGDALGLTFQQVQKYERGSNRISASRLFELSQILSVPITYFFDGADQPANTPPGLADARPEPFQAEHLSSRETEDLLRYYYRLGDNKVRKRLLDLIKSLSIDAMEQG